MKNSGALKANIGHLEGASGVAALIKTIMILERGIVPPIADLQNLNYKIDAEYLRLQVGINVTSYRWLIDKYYSFRKAQGHGLQMGCAEHLSILSASAGPIPTLFLRMRTTTYMKEKWWGIITSEPMRLCSILMNSVRKMGMATRYPVNIPTPKIDQNSWFGQLQMKVEWIA